MLFLKREGNSLSRADWLEQEGDVSSDASQCSGISDAANILWPVMLELDLPFGALIKRIEGELLKKALQTTGKTRRELARLLQTSERTLYHKMHAQRKEQDQERAAG
jgi:DNA-binding NtrC family response regulator